MAEGFTFDELVARKMQRDADREKIAEFEIGGRSLKFKRLKESKLFEILDDASEAQGIKEQTRNIDRIIYESCPILQDTRLHEEMGVVDPYDIPAALFEFTERQELGEKLLELCGISGLDEKIKNS